jgi:hypothetical protein
MSDTTRAVGENDPQLVEALKNAASVAEMTDIRRQWLIQHGAERDRFSPTVLTFDNFKSPDEASGSVSRVVKIAGRDVTFSASSMLELEKEIGAALQAQIAGGAADANANAGTERSTLQARDPRTGQFIDPTNPAVQADLKARMVRGEITPEEFIAAQPQLLDKTMIERYGINPTKVESERFTNSWAAATQEFLNSPEGSDWPGGEANKEKLGEILQENNLVDHPSAQTLARAYRYMKENDLLVANPEIENQKAIGEATSFEDLRQAAWKSAGGRPSSFWSR